ncbi:MAG: 4Fe-4S cluster-binding domain-containing protein, partial [Armatimonadota bacterium]
MSINSVNFSIAPISSAGIMLSYKCNSECQHCLYNCSPKWSDWITEEKLHSIYYGTVKSVKNPQGFHIAGGEPFINFPLLLKAVKLAREYGIPLDYVETNAGWYTDEKSAIEKLKQLKDAGL